MNPRNRPLRSVGNDRATTAPRPRHSEVSARSKRRDQDFRTAHRAPRRNPFRRGRRKSLTRTFATETTKRDRAETSLLLTGGVGETKGFPPTSDEEQQAAEQRETDQQNQEQT